MTHFSQEHLEICCYTQRIILIGYHIFMCINFLLTCLLRGMTSPVWGSRCTCLEGSTHMPLARHDTRQSRMFRKNRLFLLTCLLRGMTDFRAPFFRCPWFLLTCLLRGMTINTDCCVDATEFLLTCLLRGMTLVNLVCFAKIVCFYSHASCEA